MVEGPSLPAVVGQGQDRGQGHGQGQEQGEGMFLHAVERMIPLLADAVVSVINAATANLSTPTPLPLSLPPSTAPTPTPASVLVRPPISIPVLAPVTPPPPKTASSSLLPDGCTTDTNAEKVPNTTGHSEVTQSTVLSNEPNEPQQAASQTVPLTTAHSNVPLPLPTSLLVQSPSRSAPSGNLTGTPTGSPSGSTNTPRNNHTGRGGRLLFDSFRSVVLTPVGATPLSPDRASSSSVASASASLVRTTTAATIAATKTVTSVTAVAPATAATVVVVSTKSADAPVNSEEVGGVKVMDELDRSHNDDDVKDDDKDKGEKGKSDKDKDDDDNISYEYVEKGEVDDGDDNVGDNTRGSPPPTFSHTHIHLYSPFFLIFFSLSPARRPLLSPQVTPNPCHIDTLYRPIDTSPPPLPRAPEGGYLHVPL